MTKDEALKLALEALEFYYDLYKEKGDANAITAIKEALAQPEQEPDDRNALRRAVEQARRHEREECLKICLDYNRFYWMATHGGLKCAELIKERNDE